jgi:hypothetical protein
LSQEECELRHHSHWQTRTGTLALTSDKKYEG